MYFEVKTHAGTSTDSARPTRPRADQVYLDAPSLRRGDRCQDLVSILGDLSNLGEELVESRSFHAPRAIRDAIASGSWITGGPPG